MTKEREALKLTLAALMEHVGNYKLDVAGCAQQAAAIAAGEEALALTSTPCEVQPEQEPLAWVTQVGTLVQVGMTNLKTGLMYGWTPLYTAPPKREWVNLTVEQIEDVGFNLLPTVPQKDFVAFARCVEMLSKELNT